MAWALLKVDLAPFLRVAHCDGGVPGWCFTHDAWRFAAAAAAEDLGGASSSAAALHECMARYYAAQPLLLSGSLQRGNQVCNARVLLLRPYHLASAGSAWQQWIGTVTDLHFIAAKSALPDGVQDLLLDYQMKELMPENQFTTTARQ